MQLMLSKIAEWIQADFQGADVSCQNICTDTRLLQPGDLFIALHGDQFDGHDYLKQAEAKGAVGCVVDREVSTSMPILTVTDTLVALGQLALHYRKQFKLPVIAITGSCGKTTVKEMLKKILERSGSVLVNYGNFNNEVGVPLTLLQLQPFHDYAIIEMGARRQGDIRYLMSITDPTLSLITNVGLAHVGVFGSEEIIAEAKGEIYKHLSTEGVAVLNADEKFFPLWQSFIGEVKHLTFSSQKNADVSATALKTDLHQTTFRLSTAHESISVTLQVPGIHQVQNALAAASVAEALGIPLKQTQEGLEEFSGVKGRLESKKGIKNIQILDDTYNANPNSVQRALEVLSSTSGKKWFIFGDMLELGSESQAWHFKIGELAKALGIDEVLTVGSWASETAKGFGQGRHFSSKDTLLQTLLLELESNNVVLVKGSRGMAMEEIVNALVEKQEVYSC